MANVRNVAQYILENQGAMTTIKLQKLVCHCQAWALVWTDAPLFGEKIEAWANGPVAPDLFHIHQDKFKFKIDASAAVGDSANLSEDNKNVIGNVLKGYGDKSSQWLVEPTHLGEPWQAARRCAPCCVRCSNKISHAAMAEYYSGL